MYRYSFMRVCMNIAKLDAMSVHAPLPILGARRELGFRRTNLLGCDWVVLQRKILQLLEAAQRFQIGKLSHPVLGEHDCGEVRDARAQVGLDIRDAILGEEERAQAEL